MTNKPTDKDLPATKRTSGPSLKYEQLRRQAEKQVREKTVKPVEIPANLSPEEMRKTIYELQVYQIELEMQNEELRRVQQELDSLRERYFDLFDLAPVGYCTLSKKGLILEANLATATLLNTTRSALVGQYFSRFIHKNDQDIYYKHHKQLMETEVSQSCELRMKTHSGNPLWGHLTATNAMEKTELVCRLAIHDITRRKEDEAELKRLQAIHDITQRKEHDTERKGLQAQLYQAQKMESVGRLAGGVAHDFNNMLSVIIGHTELALDEIPPGHLIFEDLDEIQKAAQRSADLTRQLLAFARKQTVVPLVLELNYLVEDMLGMLRRIIGEDIDLEWTPAVEPLWMKLDPSQMDQILANLLVNARDAIKGVGKISIRAASFTGDPSWAAQRPGATPSDYVRLTVEDNGCGIDKEIMDNIFEPFFTTKEVGKGTGLGLSTVYGIVKQNNGYIDVVSQPDQGTWFNIYLPLIATPLSSHNETDSLEIKGTCFETILVVEDEPVILKLTTRILQSQGYTILGASTVEQAMELAEKHGTNIHLLISDVIMPEMNGHDLGKKFTADHPHLKCLFMSGYTADIIASHGVLAEGTNFIQKPFSKKELTDKVRAILTAHP